MGGIIKLEINRNVTRWIILGILIFIIFSIVILQLGISKYKTGLKQNQEFIEVESRKIQRYINYMQFGIYGFRRLLVSSPLMAMFFNSTSLTELQSFIDSGVRLKFSKPEIGKNVFERPTGGTLDFSWYLLIPASLIVMPWGFFSFRPREYLWSLMGYTKDANVYWGIMLGRILIVFTVLALTTVIIYFQYLVNGITLSGPEILSLLVFLLTSMIVLVFLLGISAGLGAVENWVKGGIIAFCSWFILVMLWPEILNTVFSKKAEANMKSIYKHEMQKTEKLMEFEKEALKHTGRYETIPEKIESDRRMAEHYWENVYKNIEKLDLEMLNQTEENARGFHFWSIFNPVTFYKSTNNELSSNGYNTYILFYKENQKIQKGFLRFYFDKRFYENYSKVEPYLKEGENIFTASPSLPAYFWGGLVVGFLYIVFSLGFSYYRFHKQVYPLPKKTKAFIKNISIALRKGKIVTLNVHIPEFVLQLLNALWGKSNKCFVLVTLDGKNFTEMKNIDFAYLPETSKIPGTIKVGTFVSTVGNLLKPGKEKIRALKEELGEEILNRRFKEINAMTKARVLFKLALLKQADIYIFHDFLNELPTFNTTDMMDDLKELKSQGVIFVDLISKHGGNIGSDYNAAIHEGENGFEKMVVQDYQ